MRRIAMMALALWAMTLGPSSTVTAIEPAGAGYDVLSRANEFRPLPDTIRPDQQPRVRDQMGGQAIAAPSEGMATPAYSAHKDGRAWVFRIAGSVPDVRSMCWRCTVARQDAARLPYYVLRYRAKGERRDYHPLAVVAVGGAAAKGQTVTVPLLDCSEVINDDRWHVILGQMSTAITVDTIEVQLSTVGSEAAVEIGACDFHSADAESRG